MTGASLHEWRDDGPRSQSMEVLGEFLLEVCYASLTIGFQSLLTYLQVTDTDVHSTAGHITNQWLHSERDDVKEYLRSIGKLLPDNLLHEFHDYGGWSIN